MEATTKRGLDQQKKVAHIIRRKHKLTKDGIRLADALYQQQYHHTTTHEHPLTTVMK